MPDVLPRQHLWKDAGCTSELDYTEQSSRLLFLKYLDALEQDKATEAALEGKSYHTILDLPYRWETWAAPTCTKPRSKIWATPGATVASTTPRAR